MTKSTSPMSIPTSSVVVATQMALVSFLKLCLGLLSLSFAEIPVMSVDGVLRKCATPKEACTCVRLACGCSRIQAPCGRPQIHLPPPWHFRPVFDHPRLQARLVRQSHAVPRSRQSAGCYPSTPQRLAVDLTPLLTRHNVAAGNRPQDAHAGGRLAVGLREVEADHLVENHRGDGFRR